MVAEQFMQNDTGGNWLPPGYFNKDQAALDESDESDGENDFDSKFSNLKSAKGNVLQTWKKNRAVLNLPMISTAKTSAW